MPRIQSPPVQSSQIPSPPKRSKKRPLAEEELLGGRLVRAIRRETGDRVRGLGIKFLEERVVVYGRCANFFCKQLVQQAALKLMRGDPALKDDQLDNQIEVG